MTQQLTEHYVGFEEGRIYYTKSGTGPPLVLLHGTGWSGRFWDKVLPGLNQHFTVINIDSVGWGNSDMSSRQWSIDEMADCIITVMNDVGIQKADICGCHTGALLGYSLAARHPTRVGKLIMDGPLFYDPVGGMEFVTRRVLGGFTDITTFDRAVSPKTTWEQAQNQAYYNYSSGVGRTQEEWERGEELRERRRYFQRLCYDSIFSYNSIELVPKIACPVLVSALENDILACFVDPCHKALKGSKVKVFKADGARGTAPQAKPEEFVQEVLAFLKS